MKASADEVKAARNICEHILTLGGPDLRSMSDDDLIAHIKNGSKSMAGAIKKTGVSFDQANAALQKFKNIFTESTPAPEHQE